MDYNNSTQLPPGLNASEGAETGAPSIDIHEPFTTAERMEQLSKIDDDIVSLLQHTSDAMKVIVQAPANLDSTAMADDSAPDTAARFAAIQTQFIETLDRIDKQLRRQIYALEEAGIITLRSTSDGAAVGSDGGPGDATTNQSFASVASSQQQDGAIGARTKGTVASLDPDGMGRYGKLDVGVLNMASNTVERDMESELWKRAREHLTRVAANQSGGDDRMQD